MNADSPRQNLHADSPFSPSPVENTDILETETNRQVLPDEEVDNVLNFLHQTPSTHDDTTPHFISSLVTNEPDEPLVSPSSTTENPGNLVEQEQNLDSPSKSIEYRINDRENTEEQPAYLVISKTYNPPVLEVVNHQPPSNESEHNGQIPQTPTEPQSVSTLTQTLSTNGNQTEKNTVPEPISASPSLDTLPEPVEIQPHLQVQLKSEGGKLQVILPSEAQIASSEYSWSEIWQQFQVRLNASDRLLVPNGKVHLDAKDRLLDGRQLQELADTFSNVKLQLESIATSRRQTAIAAVTAGYSVTQIHPQDILRSPQESSQVLADPIYLETTVRSGVEIRHPGTVIIVGDVNPGGTIVADGDILIWGRLRGIAHAGAAGNRECLIMALQMEPTQLRIADAVARAPEKPPQQFQAEVAHITSDTIRITRATDFSRTQYLNRIDPSKRSQPEVN